MFSFPKGSRGRVPSAQRQSRQTEAATPSSCVLAFSRGAQGNGHETLPDDPLPSSPSIPQEKRLLILVSSRYCPGTLDCLSKNGSGISNICSSPLYCSHRWQPDGDKTSKFKRMEVTVEKIATHKYGILVINVLIYPRIKLVNKDLLSPSLYSRHLVGDWGYSDWGYIFKSQIDTV